MDLLELENLVDRISFLGVDMNGVASCFKQACETLQVDVSEVGVWTVRSVWGADAKHYSVTSRDEVKSVFVDILSTWVEGQASPSYVMYCSRTAQREKFMTISVFDWQTEAVVKQTVTDMITKCFAK
jgi:hypothetical protein